MRCSWETFFSVSFHNGFDRISHLLLALFILALEKIKLGISLAIFHTLLKIPPSLPQIAA